MWQPLLISAGFIPALILLAAVYIERWRRKRRGERPPFSEKLLRPAGYSLQRKLEDLNDSGILWLVEGVLSSTLPIAFLPALPKNAVGRAVFLTIFEVAALACMFLAWQILGQIRACRSGLLGEQAMAEELQSLMSRGYKVFHDVPGQDKWNIDHVAVGPAGVFAIETKYRTKKPGENSKHDHRASFDGQKIQFPSGYDAEAPQQVERNARWLANTLSKATGERVTVRPIVALPGWWVDLKVNNSDVKVMSGKQVSSFIATEPPQLSDKAIRQISYQLEQRCRDVEF